MDDPVIVMGDPCACSRPCRHGARCMGGHANYPNRHWWLCSECGPSTATGWHNGEGWTFVIRQCGHRVHEATPMAGIRAADEHARTCPDGRVRWWRRLFRGGR